MRKSAACIALVTLLTYNVASAKYSKQLETKEVVIRQLDSKVSRSTSARDALKIENIRLNIEVDGLTSQLKQLEHMTDKYSMNTFVVTAYSPYDNVSGMENDGNPNVTATGTKPRPGTIAVDPTVIPYGSKIIVIYEDGSIETGIAEDCGGLIKGYMIDVFRQSYRETVNHGRKAATVIWYNE